MKKVAITLLAILAIALTTKQGKAIFKKVYNGSSSECLYTFFRMEQSFIQNSNSLSNQNSFIIKAIESEQEQNSTLVTPFANRAKAAIALTKEFDSYIHQLRTKIEYMYDDGEGYGRNENGELLHPEKTNAHIEYFFNEKNGARGIELYDKINDTRERLLSYLKPGEDITTIRSNMLYQMAADNSYLLEGDKEEWINRNLTQPAAGLMAYLAKIQNDINLLTHDVLTKLAGKINATDYKFDKLEAKVLAKSSQVFQGENFEADIILVATNSRSNPEIIVNGEKIKVESGVGKYSLNTDQLEGTQTMSGSVNIHGPGGMHSYPFTREFTVRKR